MGPVISAALLYQGQVTDVHYELVKAMLAEKERMLLEASLEAHGRPGTAVASLAPVHELLGRLRAVGYWWRWRWVPG